MKYDKSDRPDPGLGPRAPRYLSEQDGGVLMFRSRENSRGGSCGQSYFDPRDVELAIAAGWERVQ